MATLSPAISTDTSTLVSEASSSTQQVSSEPDTSIASSRGGISNTQGGNPWKTAVVNTGCNDTSSNIFNFGPTQWPNIKGKGVEKGPPLSGTPFTSSPRATLQPIPPFGQRVSLGPISLPPQPDPEELQIVYKCGGHSKEENVKGEDELRKVLHVNGSVFHCFKFFRTPEDMSLTEAPERFKKAANDVYTILRERRLAPMHSILEPDGTVVIRDLTLDKPNWYWISPSRGLYIRPSPDEGTDLYVEMLTAKYWSDLEAFPDIMPLPKDLEADFLTALTFGASERILGWNDTPFPFSDDQIQRLVRVYKDLKGQVDAGNELAFPAFNYHIARTMVKIEEYRVKAKFGTPDYQLYRPVVPGRTSWQIKLVEQCLMVVLFGAHRTYRMRLQRARIRGTVYLSDFRELLGNFLVEWSDSNLLATVFVGANIAFLAAPEVNNLQRVASLASTICSLTSIVTGVHHVWQHRTKVNASYDEARQYLSRIQPLNDGHDSDLAITAIFLSIPLVALLYAVLSFSVALGAYCIQNSEIHGRILLAVLFGIAGLTGIVTLIFFWHVWRGPRTVQISDEDIDLEMAYGWKTVLQGKWRKGRRRVNRMAQRVGKRISRARSVIPRKQSIQGAPIHSTQAMNNAQTP